MGCLRWPPRAGVNFRRNHQGDRRALVRGRRRGARLQNLRPAITRGKSRRWKERGCFIGVRPLAPHALCGTARDVISRSDVVELYRRPMATTAPASWPA
jgi:hypothetical protein